MISTLTIELTIADIAAISQEAMAQRLTGQPMGQFVSLWARVDAALKKKEGEQKK